MNTKIITIGIDGNEANVIHRAGVGQYVFELLKQFKKVQSFPRSGIPRHGGVTKFKAQAYIEEDTLIRWRIYLKEPPLPDMPEESENWRYKVFGPTKLWTRIALPLKLWRERMAEKAPDVFFSPNHYAPLFCPVPSVISVMDLAFFRFPEMFKRRDLWQLKNWTAYSVKKATKILAISEATKKDVITFFGKKPEDVFITYPGYDEERFDAKIKNQKSKIKNTLEKYKIKSNYIIYLGTLQPRKNLVRLIEAFASVKKEYPELKLVIAGMINVGRGGWMYEDIFAKVKELDMGKAVIFTNYVPDEEVPTLMAGARAYVLVSLFEGFGIPV
ncbi:MAG: glycosyltransferase family 1 protein, partial [bacterium]|nr:glycosyltransferase family 1 protein [bacterium]